MKKCLFILSIISLSICAQAQLKGDTYSAARQKKTANFTYTYFDAPGYASKSASGKMEGICIDIMAAFIAYIEKKEGIKITATWDTQNPHDFSYFLSEIRNSEGGVFGLSGTTITESRKKEYNFSIPYITNVGVMITGSSAQTMNDLSKIGTIFKGMTAITVKKTTNEQELFEIRKNYFPNMKIEYETSFDVVIAKVINNPRTFANVDFTYYLEALKNKQLVKRHPGGDTKAEKFGIIMPKSSDWTPLLDEFMKSFITSIEYRKVLSDNLGANAMKFMDSIK